MKLIVYSIPIFFILIALEVIIAHVRKSPLYRFNDAISNINCGILQQVVGALSKTVVLLGYLLIYENYRLLNIEENILTWILLFIGVDFFYYWFHRYAHEINIFWGTHVVHHQSEEYNLSVALRQSSFQAFMSMWFYLPLAFLGFNPVTFVVISTLQTLYQFWIHTRVINKMPRWFEYIFNTPSRHRAHHGRNPKYIDKNHGGTLIIFDRWFGTFQAEEEEVVYGVTKPMDTWNPVWANVDYYQSLWREFQSMPTVLDRLKLLVNKPGWRPDSIGGTPAISAVLPEHRVRFNTHSSMALYYYIALQFVILLAVASCFLNNFNGLSSQLKGLIAVFIFITVANIAALFEAKSYARAVEILRTILLGYIIYCVL